MRCRHRCACGYCRTTTFAAVLYLCVQSTLMRVLHLPPGRCRFRPRALPLRLSTLVFDSGRLNGPRDPRELPPMLSALALGANTCTGSVAVAALLWTPTKLVLSRTELHGELDLCASQPALRGLYLGTKAFTEGVELAAQPRTLPSARHLADSHLEEARVDLAALHVTLTTLGASAETTCERNISVLGSWARAPARRCCFVPKTPSCSHAVTGESQAAAGSGQVMYYAAYLATF